MQARHEGALRAECTLHRYREKQEWSARKILSEIARRPDPESSAHSGIRSGDALAVRAVDEQDGGLGHGQFQITRFVSFRAEVRGTMGLCIFCLAILVGLGDGLCRMLRIQAPRNRRKRPRRFTEFAVAIRPARLDQTRSDIPTDLCAGVAESLRCPEPFCRVQENDVPRNTLVAPGRSEMLPVLENPGAAGVNAPHRPISE